MQPKEKQQGTYCVQNKSKVRKYAGEKGKIHQ